MRQNDLRLVSAKPLEISLSSQDGGGEENVGQGGRWQVEIRQLRPTVHNEVTCSHVMNDVVGRNREAMDKILLNLPCKKMLK